MRLTWDMVFLFFLFAMVTGIIVVVVLLNFFPCDCRPFVEEALSKCLFIP